MVRIVIVISISALRQEKVLFIIFILDDVE